MNLNRLNTALSSSKLNKAQIAEQCGISRTTLDNVLSGADAKISTVESLANVLGVSMGYLFDDTTEENIDVERSEISALKKEIERLQSLLDAKNNTSTKVVVEFDVTPDEFIKMGLKDKIVQVLDRK